MSRISYVNSNFVNHQSASIHIDDRGTLFSDGVYEVALIEQNVIIDWAEHCERLQNSLNGLKINYNVSKDDLAVVIFDLLKKNQMSDAVLYLQITRGVAPRLHQFPKPEVKPSLVMTLSNVKKPSDEQYENGVGAIFAPDLRWKRRDYKTISLLPNVLAKQEAVLAGAEEAILVEDDGFITEGSATNFFIINDKGQLQTHPLNPRILGGITRLGVLSVARKNNIDVLEEAFTVEQALSAKEAFITSTTKHVLPISRIDGKTIGNGKAGDITKNIMEYYNNYIKRQLGK